MRRLFFVLINFVLTVNFFLLQAAPGSGVTSKDTARPEIL